jgi:UPF0755 protein
VYISYGTSVKEIARILEEKQVIPRAWTFLWYIKAENKFSELQAGDFILTRGVSYKEIVNSLSLALAKEIPVRIQEGKSLEEIDGILVSKGLISSGEFISCTASCNFSEFSFLPSGNIEGFFFPDTYFVDPKTFTVSQFARRMIRNFERRFVSEGTMREIEKQGKTLSQIVIMASILEKEERNKKNLPIISGILWKRLREGIALGADATTRYYEGTTALTREHFLDDNPFNTRRKLGLPPHAISNPSVASLEASLYPQESEYYYYLHDPTGKIHYSKTNDEHNQKRFQYLR